MGLFINSIHTRIFKRGESLADFIVQHVSSVQNSMILIVTTKLVSLAENRLVPKASIAKRKLIAEEADRDLGEMSYGSILTIKEGLLLASAGIDESNSESGDYILFPKDPFASARELHAELCRRWKLEKLGVIFTDSRTTPLRLGVTGVSIAHWGFSALESKVGEHDLFGRPLQMTKINIADALASAAVLTMGEGSEATPLAIIRGEFIEARLRFSNETDSGELKVRIEDDLYYPLFRTRLEQIFE